MVVNTVDTANTLGATKEVFLGLAKAEGGYPVEQGVCELMGQCSDVIAPIVHQIARLFQFRLYENFFFLHGTCMKAAQAAVEDVHHHFSLQVISDTERVKAADDLGREWNNMKRTKSCILLQQLTQGAKEFAAQVRV